MGLGYCAAPPGRLPGRGGFQRASREAFRRVAGAYAIPIANPISLSPETANLKGEPLWEASREDAEEEEGYKVSTSIGIGHPMLASLLRSTLYVWVSKKCRPQ